MATFENIELREPAAATNIAGAFLPLWRGESVAGSWKDTAIDAYVLCQNQQFRTALRNRGLHLSARTVGDILHIAKDLAEGVPKEDVRSKLYASLESPKLRDKSELLDASIDLTATLLTMICMKPPLHAYCCRSVLSWEHGSLQTALRAHFIQPILLDHDIKWEREFNASNFCRITGFSIDWTDNLIDHLRIDEDNRRLAIFHHASFLKCQQSKLFPAGLADETLKTLALFFPQFDSEITALFRECSRSFSIDKEMIKCGRLRPSDRQIERFKYWHDRLVAVKQLYDETRPRTISQLWYDNRNRIQWFTFWIAVCLLFFTVAQLIEGALQTYKAYHPTDITTSQK